MGELHTPIRERQKDASQEVVGSNPSSGKGFFSQNLYLGLLGSLGNMQIIKV